MLQSKGVFGMGINMKSIKGVPIVTIDGKPRVFAALLEALKYIFEVRYNEPK